MWWLTVTTIKPPGLAACSTWVQDKLQVSWLSTAWLSKTKPDSGQKRVMQVKWVNEQFVYGREVIPEILNVF